MSVNKSLKKLLREVSYKGISIVDGNVLDKFYEDSKFLNLDELIYKKLEDHKLFEDIYLWDRIDGNSKGDLSKLIVDSSEDEKSDDIDLEFADFGNEEVKTATDPAQYFRLIYENIIDEDRKVCFICDLSDYVFPSEQMLADQERQWLTMIAKAFKNRKLEYTENVIGSSIVFITNNLSKLPISLYQNNPDANLITIGKPSRKEREEFFINRADMYHVAEDLDETEHLTKLVDFTDEFTYKEMLQLATLTNNQSNLSLEKLMTLYKFGEYESEWEQLTSEKVRGLVRDLKKRVKGQDYAVEKMKNVVIRAKTGLSGLQHSKNKSKPKGVLFFAGPTGVGKTELAKSLAEFVFGDESSCIRFDMSEYSQEHSDQKLIGAPPGYVGYEAGGLLTNTLKERPFSVLLFDEIEKAHPRILDKFLQILEDGRLTDNKGETVYFSETVIIFTSNIGANEVNHDQSDEKIREKFVEAVKSKFHEINRPELLGRIGYNNIVPFNFIKDEEVKIQISKAKLKPLRKYLLEHNKLELVFENENDVLKFIISKADTQKGGRDILNCIETLFVNQLSNYMFEYEDTLYRGIKLEAFLQNGKIQFREAV